MLIELPARRKPAGSRRDIHEQMTRLDFLFRQHEALIGWYKQSEEKGKFLVGLNTLVVGVVNGLVFVGAEKVKAVRSVYTAPIWILLALSGLALIGSYLWILRAMWPRHHAHEISLSDSQKLWFFGDIAPMSPEKHQAIMSTWNEQTLEATMIAQNYILSKNVWDKHEALKWAIALSIGALMLLLALGVMYGFAVANC